MFRQRFSVTIVQQVQKPLEKQHGKTGCMVRDAIKHLDRLLNELATMDLNLLMCDVRCWKNCIVLGLLLKRSDDTFRANEP